MTMATEPTSPSAHRVAKIVDMTQLPFRRKPSNISIPQRASPMGKLVFSLMRETGTTYHELAHHSGLQPTTLKSWRGEKYGSLVGYEAALGAFGFRLVPCPPLDSLPTDVREKLDEISLSFRSDDEVLAAAIATFADAPTRRIGDGGPPAPRLNYKSPDRRAEDRWAA